MDIAFSFQQITPMIKTKIFLIAAIAATAMPLPAFGALPARPTGSIVLVDNSPVSFDSYNINDFNFFKLRDMAFAINGSTRSFAVSWDPASNAMTLAPGLPYDATGDEMSPKGIETKEAVVSSQKIFLAGNVNAIPIEAYNIDGYNYFKLRDMGVLLDFGVGWDNGSNTVLIDTGKGYVESQPVDSLDESVSNAVLSSNKGLHSGGDFARQAHITLKTIENGNGANVTVFAMSLYQEFKNSDGKAIVAGGSIRPVAITFSRESNGEYKLLEYWVPDEGNSFTSSLQAKFPQDLWGKVDTQFYVKALESNVLLQVEN
jgi:hypothetical protein